MTVLATSAPFFRDFLSIVLTAVTASLPLLAVAVFAARALRRRHRAAVASLVLRTALFLQAALCFVCLLLYFSQVRSSQIAQQSAPRGPAALEPTPALRAVPLSSTSTVIAAQAVTERVGDVLPSLAFVLVGAFWMTGSGLILLGLAFSAFYLQWLRRSSSLLPPDHRAYQLLGSIDPESNRATLLRTSIYVRVPFVVGPPFARSAIFLPKEYDQPPSPLCDETMALAVLCHETAHLRRHDLFWSAIGKFVVLLFWPNPLQWLLMREMEITQELACDSETLRHIRGSASLSDYAHCLLTLTAQSGRKNFVLRHNLAAMVAAPTSLTEERIENIMADRDSTSTPPAEKRIRIALFSVAALLSGACLLATAQIAPAARMPQIAPQSKTEIPRVIDVIDARDEPAISVLKQIVSVFGFEIDADSDIKQRLNANVNFKATDHTLENAVALTLRCIPADKDKLPLAFTFEGKKVRIFATRVDENGLPIKVVSLNYARPAQMRIVLDDLFLGTGFTVDSYSGGVGVFSALNDPVRIRVTGMPLPQAFEKVLQTSSAPLKYSIDKGHIKISLVNPPPPVPPVITMQLPTTPVSANFKDVGVHKALDDLLNQARCNYSIANEVPNTDKVTDTFQNLPLSAAIPRILKMSSVPLDYFVQDGIVIIRAAKQK